MVFIHEEDRDHDRDRDHDQDQDRDLNQDRQRNDVLVCTNHHRTTILCRWGRIDLRFHFLPIRVPKLQDQLHQQVQ